MAEREIYEIKIEEGALTGAPIWCGHKRGKNWMAEIELDPQSPNGLKRKFWAPARGENFYYLIPSDLEYPAPVEFGADYYTGGGHKHAKRWYGVIIAVSEEKLTLEKYETAKEAIKRAKELKSGETNRKEAIRKKIEVLEKEIEKLRAELEEIEKIEKEG
jgi:hypothetical protein